MTNLRINADVDSHVSLVYKFLIAAYTNLMKTDEEFNDDEDMEEEEILGYEILGDYLNKKEARDFRKMLIKNDFETNLVSVKAMRKMTFREFAWYYTGVLRSNNVDIETELAEQTKVLTDYKNDGLTIEAEVGAYLRVIQPQIIIRKSSLRVTSPLMNRSSSWHLWSDDSDLSDHPYYMQALLAALKELSHLVTPSEEWAGHE